jgi:hypothetical protein
VIILDGNSQIRFHKRMTAAFTKINIKQRDIKMQQNQNNTKYLIVIAAFCVLSWFVTGCSSQGELRGQTTGTGVSLAGNNYKLIKAGARGESAGFYLLGIIPIVPPTVANAKDSLYASVGQPLTGRSIALANQTEDRASLYLILFSIPKITITADVVEFTDKAQGN